jgi:hypothetical protein
MIITMLMGFKINYVYEHSDCYIFSYCSSLKCNSYVSWGPSSDPFKSRQKYLKPLASNPAEV